MKPSLIFQQILWGGLIFLCFTAAGQTEIFRETMGRDDTLPYEGVTIEWYESQDLFDNDELTMTKGGVTNGALITKNNQAPTSAGFSRYSNVYFGLSITDCGFAIEDIDASQYSNLQVKFGYRKEHPSILPAISISYWNGEEYVEVPFSFNESDDAAKAWYHSPIIDLPADAQRNDLKLRWVNAGTTGFRMDDVVLMGDPCSSTLVPCPTTLPEFNTLTGDEMPHTQSFLISGLNLSQNGLSLIAPEGFLISANPQEDFSSTLILPDYNGTEKEIWVLMDEILDPGFYEGTISISGGGAPEVFVHVSGWLIESFDIPYFNDFHTQLDTAFAIKQGFVKQFVNYNANEGGNLDFIFQGFITSPDIYLPPHSHLNVSFRFRTNTFGGATVHLACSILYPGGSTQTVFTVLAPNGETFSTINRIIPIQNPGGYDKARIKIQKVEDDGYIIKFSELSIRDLSDWTGTESTDWNTEGNWTLGVPGIKSEVIIPSTLNDPVLNGEGFAGDLTLSENATLTINPQGRLTIGRSLTNLNGTNGLVIEEGGSLIHPNEDVPGTVKRSIAAANWADYTDGWHLVSSAVENQAIENEWTPCGINNDYDFFAWSEPAELWLNQKEAANNITRFIPGQGYLAAYQQAGTKTFSGNLNAGTIPFTLTRTTGNDYSGWNLLGNPFPCSLWWNDNPDHWGDLSALGISAYARLWDSDARSYITLPPGGMIPPTTGFMIQLTEGSEQILSIPAVARTHPEASPKIPDQAAWIKLAAMEGDQVSAQETLLMVHPEASVDYDPYWDGQFLPGYAPFFYSLKGEKHLSVFSLPELNSDLVIPLNFEKNDGSAFQIALLGNSTEAQLFLYDRKLDLEQALDPENPYAFFAEPGDEPQRFELRFQPANTSGWVQPTRENSLELYSRDQVLYLTFRGAPWGQSLDVFDLSGRLLRTFPLNEGRCHAFRVNLYPGLYLARVSGAVFSWSGKVFIW